MTDIFEEEIEARLQAYEAGVGNYYKPLNEAVDEFIRFAENPDLRVSLGMPVFDELIRGVAPGELCLINGFAHSGKTVLATEILMANADNPTVLFTPDETRPAVLTKLAAADTGVGAEELERRIFRQDQTARQILLDVAAKYQQLAVYDETVTLHQMDLMFAEAQEAFGMKPKAVLFDYAEQLNESTDTKGKIDELKRWGKRHGVALFVLHQTSRSAGAAGRELGIDSGSYGGEQQATFMIVVRRKIYYYMERLRDLENKIANASNPKMIQRWSDEIEQIIQVEIPRHRNTVSMKLVKNKRPPMSLTGEIDFNIDPFTGRLFIIGDGTDDDQIPEIRNSELNFTGRTGRALLGG